MDPLSVIAGIVGITSAAIKASDTLFELVDSVRNAPAEITAISKDTLAFRDVISSLQTNLKDPFIASVISNDSSLTASISKLEKPLANCQTVLREVDGKLRSHLKPTANGGYRVSSVDVKWYFVKTGVQDLVARLESTKQTLDTHLSAIVLHCSLRAAGRDSSPAPSPAIDSDLRPRSPRKNVDNDAGSALRDYAASIAPSSPTLAGTFHDKMKLSNSSGLLTPSESLLSRSGEEPVVESEPAFSPLERLRKKENQRAGLHNAARIGDDLVLELMLAEGTDVNVRASDGKTALHLIAENGNEAGVRILLDYGADVNAVTYTMGDARARKFAGGRSPLYIAAESGKAAIVKLLVGQGADLELKNAGGRSALQVACNKSDFLITKYLIEVGASLFSKDDEDWTALHEASHQGAMEIARLLVENGAEIDPVTAEHNVWNWGFMKRATPLFLATHAGSLQVAEYLVSKGANIKAAILDGDQPIHAACCRGHLQLVKLLLDQGVDIEVRDAKYDETPLIKAASTGRTSVILYLLKEGADTNAKNLVDRNALGHCQLHQRGQHPEAVNALKKWMQEHGQAEEVKHMLLPEFRD